MKFLKILLRCVFWLLILALMAAPVYLITLVSRDEIAQYEPPAPPKLVETAVGGIHQCARGDVVVYFEVSGGFTSSTYAYQELKYKNLDRTRWYVHAGQEIQEGQVLGVLKGEDILAEFSGILVEMNTYGQDPYLRIQLLEPVELECRVEDRVLSMLRRSQSLKTQEEETVTLVYASRQKNAEGTTNVRLSIDTNKYTYGQYVGGLRIYTGQVYQQVLRLPQSCVYQKEQGEDKPWYARQVTETGVFIREVEIEIGYSDDYWVTVTGVGEGDYFDSGYKSVVEGG